MIKSRLGFRYARTLLNLLRTEPEVREVRQQLRDIREALSTPALREFIENPAISTHRKEKALFEVLKDKGVNSTLTQFLRLVAAKGRLSFLNEIVEEFELLARQRLGEKLVYVETARPLSQQERDSLISTLQAKLGRCIILRESINPQLLAGIRLKIDDKVIDATILKMLDIMREEMAQT